MSSSTRYSTVDGTSDPPFDKKGLIATFYAPRGKMARKLYDGLKAAFAVEPLQFDPKAIAAHDTTIIQVPLTASGETATAWQTMRQRVEHKLTSEMSNNWWGYSLTYQAALAPDSDKDRVFRELLPTVQQLHSSNKGLQRLAEAEMSGSWIWLLGYPEGHGLAAVTLYVALGPPEDAMALMSKVLYGPGAWLLMPDLIVHKACYVQRQYHGDYYKETIASLIKTTDPLLRNLDRQDLSLGNLAHSIEDFRRPQINISELLGELTPMYYPVVRYLSYLNGLHTDLKRYLYNYGIWQAELEDNQIIKYHSEYLKAIEKDLDILLIEAQSALEIAERARSMAQVQINEAQARNQQLIQNLLAVAAAALALPQLIDKAVAEALLELLHIPEPENGFNDLSLLATQVTVIVILVLLLRPVVNSWLRRKREG